MEEDITVRFADINDLDYCRKMDFDFISREKLEYLVNQDEIIIAEINGNPVGYLRIEYLWHRIPYIGLILVDENNRRIGVGMSLLAFTESHLSSAGHSTLYSSSQEDEPEPQEWHRHVGFEDCGIIKDINEGNIGEIVFRKRIT